MRKLKPIQVAEIWMFTIIILLLLIVALPLLRDVIYEFMGIHGGLLFKTPSNFSDLHIIFGFLIIIVGIIHISIHAGNKRSELLMKRPISDLKAFLHSLIYLIGFANREEPGGNGRYSSRQRVVYMAIVYTIGLLAISGVSLYFNSEDSEFVSMFRVTHVISAILIFLVLLFHLAINIRRHDSVALKCSFGTGKLPLGHIKKNHRIWYLKILKHEKKIVKQGLKLTKQKTNDPVAKAIIKFYEIDGVALPAKVAEELSKNLKKSNEPNDIKRFIEISKTI